MIVINYRKEVISKSIFALLYIIFLMDFPLSYADNPGDIREKMSSELCQLADSENPSKIAKEYGIEVNGGFVGVVVKFAQDVEDESEVVERYHLNVKKRIGQLLYTDVLIDKLKPLAQDDKIIYIRLPRRFFLWRI